MTTIDWLDQSRPMPRAHEPKAQSESRSYSENLHLARSIEAFWHGHGFASVMAWPELRVEHKNRVGNAVWGVASNLRAGLPPKADSRAIARLYAWWR